MKKIISLLLSAALLVTVFAGCNSSSTTEKKKITLAYQYGIAYAPAMIMERDKLLEKYLPDYEIEYKVINSGSAVTEGVASGSIDVAYVGFGPLITGATKGLFKLYSAIGGAPNSVITRDENIKSLADFKKGDQIALVNIGSAQHIALAMACKKELGNARALDENIIAMSHPDGLTALKNAQVVAQLTSTPYLDQGKATKGIHEIESVREAFPKGCPLIVGATTQALHDNTEAYEALINATNDAMDFINNNHDNVAGYLSEKTSIDKADLLTYLASDAVFFKPEPTGILEVAKFMSDEGFIEAKVNTLSDIAFDNVKE